MKHTDPLNLPDRAVDRVKLASVLVRRTLLDHAEADAPNRPSRAAQRFNATAATLRHRESRGSRYENPNRVHDLHEACEALAQRLRRLTTARELSADAHIEWADGSDRLDQLQALPPALAGIEGTLQFTVDLVAARVWPALNSIVPRLPLPERADAIVEAQRSVGAFLSFVDAMQAQLGSVERERERWLVGAGVLDATLLATAGLFAWVATLAERVEGSDAVSVQLRQRCARGARLLDVAGDQHIDNMKTSVFAALFACASLQPAVRHIVDLIRAELAVREAHAAAGPAPHVA